MDTNPAQQPPNSEQLKLLQDAFASFNQATAELQRSYDELKLKVNELNLELAEANKKLKKNLKEKEALQEHLQNILENAPNGVVVINNKGCVKNFNKAAEQITGFKFEELSDKSLKSFFPEMFPQTQQGSGKRGKLFLDSCDIKRKNGESRLVNVYVSKLRDREKRKIGSVLALEDITDIKRLKEQVQRKNRLEAMGEMAAGISHEIRNPLGAIELFASLLKRDIKGEPQKEELVENIIAGVKSLTHITSNLLLFTKSMRPKKELIDINKVINDALTFTSYAVQQKEIAIKVECDKKLKDICIDGELIKQALLNLVLNAVQAIKPPGAITLKVKRVKKATLATSGALRDFVQITVEDTGAGIPKENLDKIFNPFFTTKRSGLGLGLAIVHKIISAHDGAIEATSKTGAGTRFTILLPM